MGKSVKKSINLVGTGSSVVGISKKRKLSTKKVRTRKSKVSSHKSRTTSRASR